MNKVSESIFSSTVGVETVIIPLADVCCVEKEEYGHNMGVGKIRSKYTITLKGGIVILKEFMGKCFMKAWLYYRHEIEGGASAFISPINEELEICPDCGQTIDKGACFYCKMD